MKPVYDYVFVTHLPAFYKVNLYQAIAKHCRVLVIFIASGSVIRTPDFVASMGTFDHIIVNKGAFEERSVWESIYQINKIIRSIRYRLLVLGGWDLPEFWWLAFRSPKRKNALALESSVHESHTQGGLKYLKKLFLLRINTIFASGTPHRALLQALQYQGRVITTLGVGIFHYAPKKNLVGTFQGRFLYVGRLSPEKNLVTLIDVFRQLSQFHLMIVGQGPQYAQLNRHLPANVTLVGHVPNEQLAEYYQENDIFILPSIKEPWGIVVEEALYYGLPVVASNRVGCATDWIEQYRVGHLFDPMDRHALEEAILWAASHYDALKNQIKQINFVSRDDTQIQKYVEALP